jgi:hypothetical protein
MYAMELLYKKGHFRCINYEQYKKPNIRVPSIDEDKTLDSSPLAEKWLFPIKGKILSPFIISPDYLSNRRQILYLPSGTLLECRSSEQIILLAMCIEEYSQFGNHYKFKHLKKI